MCVCVYCMCKRVWSRSLYCDRVCCARATKIYQKNHFHMFCDAAIIYQRIYESQQCNFYIYLLLHKHWCALELCVSFFFVCSFVRFFLSSVLVMITIPGLLRWNGKQNSFHFEMQIFFIIIFHCPNLIFREKISLRFFTSFSLFY